VTAIGDLPRPRLAARLLEHLRGRRFFRAKARPVRDARIADVIPLGADGNTVVMLEVRYQEGEPDLYVMPLALPAPGAPAHALVAAAGDEPLLADGLATGQAGPALLELIRAGRVVRGESGALVGEASPLLAEVAASGPLPVTVHGAEQTNSTLMFGDRVLLKVYRQVVVGENPELEVGRFLTDHCQPACAPRVLGSLGYQGPDGGRGVAIAHELVANRGDAWTLALAEVRAYLEAPGDAGGGFGPLARTLGRRTAELHLALVGDDDDPQFAPEPLTAADRRALVARASAMLEENLAALAGVLDALPPAARQLAGRLLEIPGRQAIARRLTELRERELEVVKIRTHGDLHLGQVLVCGDDDFMIIDFEGEPGRPLAERRAKHSPLRDVMGMARSFDYAPEAVLREPASAALRATRAPLGRRWTQAITAAFLRGYLGTVGPAPFLPRASDELALLCGFYELEKVIYELGYEANNRPDWVEIPVRGLAAMAGVKGD
jgi:maltose alpha-D-glucosyltransferase/alpha-amylase